MIERKTLIADEGYIYTDGTNFGKEVYLAEGDGGSSWHQISMEEYELATGVDDATEDDYQEALESLGVKFNA